MLLSSSEAVSTLKNKTETLYKIFDLSKCVVRESNWAYLPNSRVDYKALVCGVGQADGFGCGRVNDGHRFEFLAVTAQEAGARNLWVFLEQC